MTSFRTPRRRTAGLGSAKHGATHWIAERVTSIALVPLSLWVVFAVLKVAPLGYDQAVLWLQHPLNLTLAILFTAVAAYHMGMGAQVVVEDYIHKKSTLVTLLVLNFFLWAGVAAWTIVSLLRVAIATQVGVVL